jgi:hypothetical protein
VTELDRDLLHGTRGAAFPNVVTAAQIPAGEYVPAADQRIVLSGVTWEHYEMSSCSAARNPAREWHFSGERWS